MKPMSAHIIAMAVISSLALSSCGGNPPLTPDTQLTTSQNDSPKVAQDPTQSAETQDEQEESLLEENFIRILEDKGIDQWSTEKALLACGQALQKIDEDQVRINILEGALSSDSLKRDSITGRLIVNNRSLIALMIVGGSGSVASTVSLLKAWFKNYKLSDLLSDKLINRYISETAEKMSNLASASRPELRKEIFETLQAFYKKRASDAETLQLINKMTKLGVDTPYTKLYRLEEAELKTLKRSLRIKRGIITPLVIGATALSSWYYLNEREGLEQKEIYLLLSPKERDAKLAEIKVHQDTLLKSRSFLARIRKKFGFNDEDEIRRNYIDFKRKQLESELQKLDQDFQ